jgi:hypothetical protein
VDAQSSFPHTAEPDPSESPSAETGVIAETPRGRFRGLLMPSKGDGLVGAFLGIPYAEPPLRELRFRVSKKTT